MAMWRGDRNSLSPLGHRSDQGWDADLGRKSFRNTPGPSSPLTFLDHGFWDNRSLFKDQKSLTWSSIGLSGSNRCTKMSNSSLDSHCRQKHGGGVDIQRWSSTSRPDGAPRPQCSKEEFELKAAPEESSVRRAELVRSLREAKSHLDAQTDLCKTRDTQLQHNHSISQFMELKHKQLSETVSVLEQDKETAEQSHFNESRRRAELQDKVLQLELDILKMRSNLERRTPPASPNPLINTSPVTKDEILIEGQKQTEMETKWLREALRRAEERVDDLDYEKKDALRQLKSYKENQQEAMNQTEELKRRLNRSVQTQTELKDQLKESQSRLEQMELERDLLSTKTQRLEDGQNDLKTKLSGALMDKDRLIQEKTEQHQRVQALELQLQREQRGKQSFNEQVCELHTELSQAKNQASKQKKDTIFRKEELLSLKELNEKLSSDLTRSTERLQVTLKQLHELEANKLIQTNQIAALETERFKLIGENANNGFQDEIGELKDKCCQQRELLDNLKLENQNLQVKCQDLEKKVQSVEAEYNLKEEGLQCAGVGFEQEKEELRKVAAHWNERWLDVSMMLCATQAELEGVKKQQQENDEVSSEDVDGELAQMKEELRKVSDLLKIRDTELVERQRELQTACSQVSQESSEVERLKQLLAERDQKLREKDQDLTNLEIQSEKEKAEAKVKLSALELKLRRDKDLHSEEEVVSNDYTHEDFESLRALLEEYSWTAEELKQERDHAMQQLHDLESSQQFKAEKQPSPEAKKPSGLDPNEQRRLVTEQLKSLFREREQRGERSGLFENEVQNPKSIKQPLLDPSLTSPLCGQKHVEEQDLKQGAAKESSSKTSPIPRGPKISERTEHTQKPGSKNAQMSTLGEEMENLTERGENLKDTVISPQYIQMVKARSQPSDDMTLIRVTGLQNLKKGKVRQKNSPLGCRDGTFYARQIEVCDSSHVEESSRGGAREDTPLKE
ncbi:interaptin [Triplophysa dalaica]|uniref:interaptin n=1 Tax=Triplophysa dalaica TaxID=1582913 RepID=UPI0024DFD1A3|nr:interaptin [Triplophysa dalaica]